MDQGPLKAAPNYTTPTLVMAWVNLMWVLVALWALWGWLVVLPLAVTANWAIDRLEDRLNAS